MHSGILTDAATLKLMNRIPYHVAMELLFTGRWMGAAEGFEWGWVNEVLPSHRLDERVWQIARTLSSNAQFVSAVKRLSRVSEGRPVSVALTLTPVAFRV